MFPEPGFMVEHLALRLPEHAELVRDLHRSSGAGRAWVRFDLADYFARCANASSYSWARVWEAAAREQEAIALRELAEACGIRVQTIRCVICGLEVWHGSACSAVDAHGRLRR